MKFIKKIAAATSAAALISAFAVDLSSASALENWAVNYTDDGTTEDGAWDYFISDESVSYDKHICIFAYNGDETDIVIPSEIEGLPVQRLEDVFCYWTDDSYYEEFPEAKEIDSYKRPLSSLVIPASVKDSDMSLDFFPHLKKLVFEGDEICFHYQSKFKDTAIEELEIPKPLPDWRGSTNLNFANNPELRKVSFKNLGEKFTIDTPAFANCPKLTELCFPPECRFIEFGGNSFASTGFTELDFTQDVDVMTAAFSHCENLKSLNFRGETQLHGYSFRNCESLSDITFKAAPVLSKNAFYGCNSLENINYDTESGIEGLGFSNCVNLRNINNEPVFNEESGDFFPDKKDIVKRDFAVVDNVGFINDYINATIKKVVAEEITPDMTDIEKLRVLHDWVCAHTEYEPNESHYSALTNHVDSSVFITGTSVCEGYARAMNLLCHEAGIESCYVCSSDHAWNIVKIGGHWLHTDSTWDDFNKNMDWFLHSDSELTEAGGSHKTWHLTEPSELHTFQCKTMPVCNCPMGDVNTDGKVGAADLVTYSRYLLGAQEISADDAVLADLNFDGSCDCFDMVSLRKKAVSGT